MFALQRYQLTTTDLIRASNHIRSSEGHKETLEWQALLKVVQGECTDKDIILLSFYFFLHALD